MARKKKDNQLCGFCGKNLADTVDHIPPKTVFAKPRPADLITIPACFACNNSTSSMDEEFGLYVSIAVGVDNPQTQTFWTNGAFRTLQHNKRLIRQVTESATPVRINTDSGLVDSFMIQCPKEPHDAIFKKIVRGLYWHQYKVALGNLATVDVRLVPIDKVDLEIIQLMSDMPSANIGNGQFQYWYWRDPVQPLCSGWFLLFHERHLCFALTSPSNP